MVVALLALTGCGRPGAGGGGSSDWPTDRTFLSTGITEGGKDRPLVAGTTVSLQFHEPGRLTANAGCNTISGDGRIEGDHLRTGDLAITDMGCLDGRADQDTWLANFLSARPAWRLTGDDLVLTTSTTEVRLVDRRVVDPDRPLVGRRWVVVTQVTGDAASSVPDGAAYLEFRPDGTLTGDTGCAAISGPATVSGDAISIGTLARTPRPCSGQLAQLDAAVTATLAGSVRFTIRARSLTLAPGAPHGLVLTAQN